MDLSSLFSGAIIGAFITVVIGAVLTGYFNIRTKDKEYKNSYYKMILEKRLQTYEELNSIINILYKSVRDFLQKVYLTNSVKFWLSDKTSVSLKTLINELSRCSSFILNGKTVSSVGKEEYQFIAELRDKLEESLLNDMK